MSLTATGGTRGGRLHAPGGWWWLAGLSSLAIVLVAVIVAIALGHRPGRSRSRRAALLGAATGISWGFVAAVIKELSSHLGDGVGAIDPLSASLLGIFLLSEHIQTAVPYLAGEAGALAIVVAGATALSHSQLIAGEDGSAPAPPIRYQAHSHRQP